MFDSLGELVQSDLLGVVGVQESESFLESSEPLIELVGD